ncbi:MAG: AAA family ATPase [Candidatus Krumholzibacteriia bacterium]
MGLPSYIDRFLQSRVEESLLDSPVVLIHGPRRCGKTTLARHLGEIHGHVYLSFDDEGVLAAAREDPVGFVTGLPERVILDMARIRGQEVLPDLLTATADKTAQIFNLADLAAPFSPSRPTIGEYVTLLERIFLIHRLRSWHFNSLSRMIKSPKLQIGDTGLACTLLRPDGG